MGWSCGNNGRLKTGEDSRCSESGWEKEAKKTENPKM